MATKLNLASKPFSNRSLPWVLAAVIIAVSLVSLVFIVRSTAQARAQADLVQNDINTLSRREQELRQRATAIKNSLTSEQLQTLGAAHTLVERKHFSWSRLFADLESALPGNVRVKRIAVRGVTTRGNETRAELELTVVAKTPATVTEMIADMGRGGIFTAYLRAQNLQRGRGETGSEYDLEVVYRPRAGDSCYQRRFVISAAAGNRSGRDDPMSEQTPSTRRAFDSDRIRTGLQQLNFARDYRVFGPAEIIVLGGSLLILLLVVVSYLYFLMPAKSRLGTLQSERSLLQTKIRTAEEEVVQGESTEATVVKITDSLNTFEQQGLLGADRGRMDLYDSLNAAIRKNGLRNTSGPTYTPLEAANSKAGTSGAKSVVTKWQSIYPGIAISVTVEGQYQNLRRLIRDLEMNKQLVIINSVELERSTDTNNAPSAEGTQPGSSNSALVSLRLEMSTYFQRALVSDGGTNEVVR